MTERLLQFIWQFSYFNKSNLTTIEGEPLLIILPGIINKNQGPDFSAAKIRIGNTTFFGTIELHLQTSGWEKHQHQSDKQYNNVILHVVFQHDKELNNAIPTLELQARISTLLLERYSFLMSTNATIPCSNNLAGIKELVWLSWKERLLAERLTRKSEHILQLLKENNFHWEETFWWLLARNFGSKINGEAFEVLARSIPINLLAKHKSSIHQIEALLFGQANLLNEDFEDDYPKLLQREYNFLKKKYNLRPSPIPVLFLRMRPGNFPTIRLAQLAMLIQTATHLFSKILEADKIAGIKTLFTVAANDFWHYHYTFQQSSAFKKKTIGNDTIDNIIINSVIPMLFAYAIHHNEEKYKDKALRWLEEITPESNTITKEFVQLGLSNGSAYDSQALIELKNEYCLHKRCLDCAVGNNLLREAAGDYKAMSNIPV
jgi:hypothetical protein